MRLSRVLLTLGIAAASPVGYTQWLSSALQRDLNEISSAYTSMADRLQYLAEHANATASQRALLASLPERFARFSGSTIAERLEGVKQMQGTLKDVVKATAGTRLADHQEIQFLTQELRVDNSTMRESFASFNAHALSWNTLTDTAALLTLAVGEASDRVSLLLPDGVVDEKPVVKLGE